MQHFEALAWELLFYTVCMAGGVLLAERTHRAKQKRKKAKFAQSIQLPRKCWTMQHCKNCDWRTVQKTEYPEYYFIYCVECGFQEKQPKEKEGE